MEDRLDRIEEGEQEWVALMREFYGPFEKTVAAAEEGMEKFARESDITCPSCGKHKLVEKFGRMGKFLGCPGYPECKYIHREAAAGANGNGDGTGAAEAPAPVVSDIPCPNCGSLLVEKTGRFGKFLACPRYPECKYIHKEQPKTTGVQCPECKQGEIAEKKSRMGVFYSCNRYPACKFSMPGKPLPERPCPQCGGLMGENVFRGHVKGVKCSNKACGYTENYPASEQRDEKETAMAA
jgi:DNA topoisomerase I